MEPAGGGSQASQQATALHLGHAQQRGISISNVSAPLAPPALTPPGLLPCSLACGGKVLGVDGGGDAAHILGDVQITCSKDGLAGVDLKGGRFRGRRQACMAAAAATVTAWLLAPRSPWISDPKV